MSDDTTLSQKMHRFSEELRGPDGYPTSEYDELTRFAFLVEDLEAENARLREEIRAYIDSVTIMGVGGGAGTGEGFHRLRAAIREDKT